MEQEPQEATARSDLVITGSSSKSQLTFIHDASRIWNKAPLSIKQCNSVYLAKKEVRKFVANLPI